MVEELVKIRAISNQKFNQKGMQLSQLKGNKQVYEFFKNAGLSDANYVYASDIQNIFDKFDANDNGKLSVKEAREMGFEGSRKEVKKAVAMLNQILEISNIRHKLLQQKTEILKNSRSIATATEII